MEDSSLGVIVGIAIGIVMHLIWLDLNEINRPSEGDDE